MTSTGVITFAVEIDDFTQGIRLVPSVAVLDKDMMCRIRTIEQI